MNRNGLEGRIEMLEQMASGADDVNAMAFGEGVTDDELRELANTQSADPVRYRVLNAGAMSDAQLWRIVMPAIQALRTQGNQV